jgi:protein-arginine kinase activator protein McsA
MFGNEKNFNDIFRAFDEMFSQFDSRLGEWKTQTRVSDDGTTRITTYYRGNEPFEIKKPSGVKSLEKQLEIAIENEDFEMAVELRDKIKKLETNQKQIEELEKELKQSIKDQNFEKSIELRDKLKELKK